MGAAGRLAKGANEAATTADSWFDLASVTKSITALAVARLARHGKLAFQAPIGTYLPDLADTPSGSIPLILFLAHRAGLDGHRSLYRDLLIGRFADKRSMLREAALARRTDAVGAPPASGFAPLYSDLGFLLAGEVVARVGGAPLDAGLRALVLQPLGAEIASSRLVRQEDASFERRVAATEIVPWRGGTVRGFVHDENAWAFSGDGTAGHAGLFGTVRGVLAVGRAIVDVLHGRLPAFLTPQEMHPLVVPRPGGTLLAGFDGKSDEGSSSGVIFGKSTVGHLGFTGTSLWCDVDQEMVGVLLTNRVHPTRESETIRQVRPLAYDRIGDWAASVRRG